PATRRKELQQARTIQERRRQTDENRSMSIKDLLNERLRGSEPDSRDTLDLDTEPPSMEVDSVDLSFEQPSDSTIVGVSPDSLALPSDTLTVVGLEAEEAGEPDTAVTEVTPGVVNTDDYEFEEEPVRETQPGQTFMSRYMKAREKS